MRKVKTPAARKRAPEGKALRAGAKLRKAASPASDDRFRHVVVLMLENRSFDHVLGALAAQIPGLDGVATGGPPRTNLGPDGNHYPQAPGAVAVVTPDPKHENSNVLDQIRDANGRFVADYANAYAEAKPAQWQEVMAYHATDSLPSIQQLARTFAVCDAWFSSVPGPTWTNRLFAMSGTSQGRVEMPAGNFKSNLHRYDQPSLFKRIEEAGRRSRIYFGDFPLALLLADRRTLRGAKSFVRFDRFEADAAGKAASFPDFVWIEPSYMGWQANDDHPPHDVGRGQALVASVYEAIRANEELWLSTLLVVTYDEHGGFYDHRSPPEAIPPDGHHEEYAFDRMGVRVPAVLVSPWIEQQVVKTPVDHTALLRSLQVRWKLGDMGRRVATAPDLLAGLKLTDTPRDSTMPKARRLRAKALVKATKAPAAADRLSDNEQAIVAFSAWLDTKTPGAPRPKARVAAKAVRGADQSREAAKSRAARFLKHRGARL